MASSAPLPVAKVRLPSNVARRYAVSIDNVLSGAECLAWIARADAAAFVPALINVGGGREVAAPSVRSSTRVMFDDLPTAADLWARIRHAVPVDVVPRYEPIGLNERLRFLRYDPGQHFSPHFDGSYPRPDGSGERSFLTLLLYLNVGYEGGFTTFYGPDGDEPGSEAVGVEPAPGRVILHEHALLHGVPPLEAGRKYVVRTDVMFRPRSSRPRPADGCA